MKGKLEKVLGELNPHRSKGERVKRESNQACGDTSFVKDKLFELSHVNLSGQIALTKGLGMYMYTYQDKQ
jgi:hypothetical protein